MVFNMITLKSTTTYIITACFLILLTQFTIGWNNKRYIVWILTLPMLSLSALLGLNTVVLYIYLKYFVSPHAKRKADSFKPLRFTHNSIWPRLEKLRQLDNTPSQIKSLDLEDPEIEAAFNQLLQYMIRDFISSWFIKITGSPSEQSFPIAVDHIIRSAASNVSTRLKNTDLLFVTINKIIPKMTNHISEFRTAETSLRGKSLERSVTQSDELDLLLASRFRHGKLHPALTTAAVTTKPTEIVYLRHLIERVLPFIIEKKELSSGPVRVVIREIVSNSVLQPVLDMLADPDFWNQTIDTYVRGKKFMQKKKKILIL
jgi:sorting nexin-25